MYHNIRIEDLAAYASIIGLCLSCMIIAYRIIKHPNFWLYLCDKDGNSRHKLAVYFNGKKKHIQHRGCHRKMIGCVLEDLGKKVSVFNRDNGKHLGSFTLVRKSGETIVKHVLDCENP